MKRGDIVRVIKDPDGLVTGWTGTVLHVDGFRVTTRLHEDVYPSTWNYYDLELLNN